MKKRHLFALGKDRDYLYIIVAKDKSFFDWLSRLLFESFKIYDVDKIEYDRKANWISKKKNIKNYIDKHESFYAPKKEVRIDLFYGYKRAVIAVIAPKKGRDKFLKVLEKYTKWEKISRKQIKHKFWK